ncbi:hypothetical protein OSB04_030192 [Centaurea solstitialis]|uniref:Integrase catalytic domain-containing protein n=1 Tax=Centaurea solstitialis TaxID=347529 RepID=A0AA38S8B1_9ASTR|nr:hypothetical protein OSB04_030192 [Centaurea solstitialis]
MADKPKAPSSSFHPALAVSNIKNHISITLEMENVRNATWAKLFKVHAKSHRVLHHIIPPKDKETTPATDEEKEMWSTLDATVLGWIYATISTDWLHTILEPDSTAMDTWNRLRLTDAYNGVGTLLHQSNPLPAFYQARSMLMLEEAGLNKKASGSAMMANTRVPLDSGGFSDHSSSINNAGKKPQNKNGGQNRGGGRTGSKGNSRGGSTHNRGWNVSTPQRPQQWNSGQGPWGWQWPWAVPSCSYPTSHWARPIVSQSKPHPQQRILGPRPHQAYTVASKLSSPTGPIRPTPLRLSCCLLQTSKPPCTLLGSTLRMPIVRKFTTDNSVSVEFDPFGFSVKDFKTGTSLMRCESRGELYPINTTTNTTTPPSTFVVLSSSLWHDRLGHPGATIVDSLRLNDFIKCNQSRNLNVCRACSLGKHTKLPFVASNSRTLMPFDVIHCDLLTSPVLCSSGHRYYMLLFDDYSNFLWAFPLSQKSQVFATFLNFRAFIRTQFERDIKTIQCDNGREFDNSSFWELCKTNGNAMAYLFLYVDDIILTASSHELCKSIISLLSSEFAMKDLGPLSYFLGIAVTRHKGGLFLSQRKYTMEIVDRARMSSCKPSSTPVDTKPKLCANASAPYVDPTLYRSLAGAPEYLTFARPDITYAVQQVCLFMHDPRDEHMHALKRIVRYIQGTLDHGLHLYPSTTSSLVSYTDANWGGCPDTRRSTSGYCVYMGDNLVSWSAKQQATLSRSNAEAEYRGVANVVSESCWLRNLLLELHCPVSKATLVYCDNVSAIYLSGNLVQHQRTKHVEMDVHFVREKVARGQVRVCHVPSRYQIADIFTKGLPVVLFDDFRNSLNVLPPPVSTVGEC